MCKLGANKIPAPDTGYAWFMVFISGSCYLVGNGIAYSFGVLFAEFVEYFQASHSEIAFISSILLGMMYLPCFITSALVTCIGPRPVAFTGAVLTMTGLALCYFASSVIHLYIFLGIVGLGSGLLVYSPFVAMYTWFRKRAGIASGLSMGLGTSAGMFIFAPLTQWLIDSLGWRGTMLIMSGIAGQCVILTLLIREAPEFPSENAEEKKEHSDKENNNGVHESLLKISTHDHSEPSHGHLGSSFATLGNSLASLNSLASVRRKRKQRRKKETEGSNINDTDVDNTPLRKLFFSIIRESFDLSVFKNCKVTIMMISEVFHIILYIVPSVFLPDKAMSYGIKPTHAALLISIISVASAIFNLIFGLLTDVLVNYRPYISAVTLTLVSAVNICSMYMTTFPLLVFYAVVSGIQMAIVGSVQPVIIRDISGLNKAAKVLSLWYVGSGLSALIAGPLIGGMYDWTKDYDLSFIVAGSLGFITVASLFALPNVDRCSSSKRRSSACEK